MALVWRYFDSGLVILKILEKICAVKMVSYFKSEFNKLFAFNRTSELNFWLLIILENVTMRHGYIESVGF